MNRIRSSAAAPGRCAVGQRAYYAVRLLRQHGFDARQLPGGFETFKMLG